MLYEDEKKIADQIVENTTTRKPLVDFVDEQNVRHRLFAITAKSDIDAIAKMMLNKSCIIADGHHRYETALNYYKETANPAAAYQIIAFVNTHNEGLLILATHRLLGNLENFQLERLLADLKENFIRNLRRQCFLPRCLERQTRDGCSRPEYERPLEVARCFRAA